MNEHEDYLFLGAGTPDPEIVALEHLLSPLAHDGCELPLERLGPDASHRATLRPWLWLAAAMLVSLAMALALSRATKLQRGSSSRTFVAHMLSMVLSSASALVFALLAGAFSRVAISFFTSP